MDKNYLQYSLRSSMSRRHSTWFYIGNHQPGLPKTNNGTLKYSPEWVEELRTFELTDVPKLVAKIKALKAKGVTGVSVAYSWFEHRI